MGVNHVVFGNTPVIDIRDSTVNASNLLKGEKAYSANGDAVEGSLVPVLSVNSKAPDSSGNVDLGTIPVSQGGTGKNTWTANQAVITGSTATGAFTSRTIINNTTTTNPVQRTAGLITANTLSFHTNRTSSVAAGDSNYTTYMARGEALVTTDTTPTNNGQIAWVYG